MKRSVLFIVLACLVASFASAATTEGHKDLLPLGSAAPEFSLPDVATGKQVALSDVSGKKALMVVFLCRHCPYVQHIKSALSAVGRDYAGKDIAIVAISANDPAAYPADAPASLAEMAKEEGFTFPLLFDESQDIAHAYTAVATPDTFIFDKDLKLVYRGQFDDTRPDGDPATGADVRAALDALLNGQPVSGNQKPAIGCGIKWKK